MHPRTSMWWRGAGLWLDVDKWKQGSVRLREKRTKQNNRASDVTGPRSHVHLSQDFHVLPHSGKFGDWVSVVTRQRDSWPEWSLEIRKPIQRFRILVYIGDSLTAISLSSRESLIGDFLLAILALIWHIFASTDKQHFVTRKRFDLSDRMFPIYVVLWEMCCFCTLSKPIIHC